MTVTRTMWWILAVISLCVWAAAQDNSSQQPATTPAPAFGQNAPILDPDNPPLSGLDEPGLELRSASRSFIAPALQLSQSAEANAFNQFGNGRITGITRILGAFDLQRFWEKSDFRAEYLGGGAFYSNDGSVRQLQAVGAEAVTRWRTGQATLRDSFSYLPEGAFSLGFGDPGLGLAGGRIGTGEVLPGFHTGTGSVGLVPRLTNTAILDVVESINPRSAFTVAGAFANSHFFDNTLDLINSDQTTIEGGYSRLLNRRDQVAGIYGFQIFRFPQGTGGQLQTQIGNLRWSHTITGKLSLIAGAGPQYTVIQFPGAPDITHWSANGRLHLRYRWSKRTSLVAGFEKFTSSGSGFFAGADTERAQFAVRRELGRTLELVTDLGYSHNKRLQPFTGAGAAGNRYDEGFAGAILRKHIGRAFDVFAVYRFAEIGFDNADPLCGLIGAGRCGNTSQRHAGTVGVEWHPTPIRIE